MTVVQSFWLSMSTNNMPSATARGDASDVVVIAVLKKGDHLGTCTEPPL